MVNRNKGIEKFPMVLILLLLPLLVIPSALFGEDKEIEAKKKVNADYELMVKDDLVSLSAKDASLKKIIEELGNRMKIEVVGNIPDDEKSSVEFENLSLPEALEKLSSNYGYLIDTEKEQKSDHGNVLRITKIFVLPKGEETAPLIITAKDSEIQEKEGEKTKRPEPFKFEFNPMDYVKDEK